VAGKGEQLDDISGRGYIENTKKANKPQE